MRYTRLYADSDGETHFEEVDVEFNDGQIRSGGPTIGLSAPQPSSDCFFLATSRDPYYKKRRRAKDNKIARLCLTPLAEW